MKRLAGEKSPYLRHAATQPVDWYPWGEEAFRTAAEQDKPIFLSSGAVWCHWCHVMAQESFCDPAIAALLNAHFICIKLDRDERPDIDRRYQRLAALAGVGGGWPLSLFLTPDRKPFFVGTYFPPRDAYGRPGFGRIVESIAGLYRTKREEIDEHARDLSSGLVPKEREAGAISVEFLDEAAGRMLAQFDSKNGGFGTAPKFPMPGAIDFLLQRYALTGNGVIGNAVRRTLEAMARGGFHDQLAGGFHRYSVDEAWGVPHFEKMADDNAWLLRNYVDAYAVFGDAYFADVARGIITFIRDTLSDPAGGFYASQDADVTPDDEGGYFTWTEAEIREVVTPEEYGVLSRYLLSEDGSTHHDPSKKVLRIAAEPEQIASQLGADIAQVRALIASGKQRLLDYRRARTEPFIDRTLYTSQNGAMIAAFYRASRVLKDKGAEELAQMSLGRIVAAHVTDEGVLHTVGIKGLLDDYTALIDALIEAYVATSDRSHLELADRLMEQTIARFSDNVSGGFFDAEEEVLGLRLKDAEDVPHPAANSTAILLLLKLSALLKKESFRAYAERGLNAFIASARASGVHAGYFFTALDAFFHLLTFECEAPPDSTLGSEVLAQVKPHAVISYSAGPGRVIPCFGTVCHAPIDNAADFLSFVHQKRYLHP
jgi:uncharacterized protein YyaL (SSP411 family)